MKKIFALGLALALSVSAAALGAPRAADAITCFSYSNGQRVNIDCNTGQPLTATPASVQEVPQVQTGESVGLSPAEQDSVNQQINAVGDKAIQENSDVIAQQGFDALQNDVSNSPYTSGCGSGSVGGSLGSVGAQLQKTLGGILPGQLGGAISSRAIGSLPGVVAGLTGNSIAGQAVSALLNGNVGSVVQGVLGGSLGGIGGALGGLTGGALGSVVGVAGLGGEVPVNDSRVRHFTGSIDNYQAIYNRKVCQQDLTVRSVRKQLTAEQDRRALEYAATGRDQQPIYYSGPAEDVQRHDTITNAFVDTIGQNADPSLAPAVQRSVVQDYEYRKDLANQLRCPVKGIDIAACKNSFTQCGRNSKEQWANWTAINGKYRDQCTFTGLSLNAQSTLSDLFAESDRNTQQALQQGRGYYPNIRCNDPSMTQAQCFALGDYTVITPGVNQEAEVVYHQQSGERQQENASQIGELVNGFLSQLGTQLLTSLTGLAGLSEQSPNGGGSYLDRAVSGTSASTLAQAKAALQNDIDDSSATELQYENDLNAFLNKLENTKSAYASLASCASKTTRLIGSSTPQAVADQASTTVSAIIEPQINQKNADFAESQDALTRLTALGVRVQNARTSTDLNSAADEYQALLDSGALHTQNDIAFLENDLDASGTTLSDMLSSANASLAACEANR